MHTRPIADLLTDDVFIHIASWLDVRTLGRLAAVSSRFNARTMFTDRTRPGSSSAPACWSLVNEGARLQLERSPAYVVAWVPRLVTCARCTLEQVANVNDEDDEDWRSDMHEEDEDDEDEDLESEAIPEAPLLTFHHEHCPAYDGQNLQGAKFNVVGCTCIQHWHNESFAAKRERISVADADHMLQCTAEAGLHGAEEARKLFLASPESCHTIQVPHQAVEKPSGSESTWLELLAEALILQSPLRFTHGGQGIVLREDCTFAVNNSPEVQSAVCGSGVMRAGKHYAEFTIATEGCHTVQGVPYVKVKMGVVGASFDPRDRFFCQIFTLQPRVAYTSADGHMFCGYSGRYRHGRGDRPYECRSRELQTDWPGCPGSVRPGDVIGLLLDVDAGSLDVYLNGTRCGRMIVSGLTQPLRWAVDLGPNSGVRVTMKPPPHVSADDLHDDERKRIESSLVWVAPPALGEHTANDERWTQNPGSGWRGGRWMELAGVWHHSTDVRDVGVYE